MVHSLWENSVILYQGTTDVDKDSCICSDKLEKCSSDVVILCLWGLDISMFMCLWPFVSIHPPIHRFTRSLSPVNIKSEYILDRSQREPTHRHQGFEPGTFLLFGNSANHPYTVSLVTD